MRIFAASADRPVRRRQILLACALLGSVLVLASYTILFGTLAWLGWRRDEGEKFR